MVSKLKSNVDMVRSATPLVNTRFQFCAVIQKWPDPHRFSDSQNYLRIVAYELIEDDNSDEKYAIWTTMTRAEKDTANDLVEAMFSEWL